MDTPVKTGLVASCRALLRPIVRLLLKCGITWKEFADLAKSVFVETATSEFGIKGRPTNVSRVSILTGISRKEVKRQRDLLDKESAATSHKTTDATRVLSGWHQDSEYLGPDAEPLELAETGPHPSFESLCARYGGDIPRIAMLKELVKTKAMTRTDDGRLRVRSRHYMPVPMDRTSVLVFGEALHDLASTLEHNITATGATPRRFQGYAFEACVDRRKAAAFDTFLDKLGSKFLEDVDAWLTRNRAEPDDRSIRTVRLGVGAYAIRGDSGLPV